MSVNLLEDYNNYKSEKKKFFVRGYARKSTEESDSRSVTNQRKVIEDVFNNIVENDLDNEYIFKGYLTDENCTGTDSLRPDFQKLLREVANSETNMIIVTDLSRLSRNIEESLHYVQGLFVSFNVRFVSHQLPTIDSYLHPESIYGINVPFHSLMNENHCAESSLKIRERFSSLRKQGLYIGAFAPYGWNKNPDDYHKLIIDEYVYDVMHQIKNWLFEGLALSQIRDLLTEKGILAPAAYARSKGSAQCYGNKEPSRYWDASKIRHIMLRPANTGVLIQGREEVVNYKIHIKRKTTPDKWSVHYDCIPSIFTKEEQERINSILSRSTYYSNERKTEYLFTGLLVCADCGKSVVHKKSTSGKNTYYLYMCNSYRKNIKACTSHRIKADELEKAVLESIQQQIALILSYEELISKFDNTPIVKKKMISIEETIKPLKREKQKLEIYSKTLYEDLKDGILERNEYLSLKSEYTSRLNEIDLSISNLQQQTSELEQSTDKKNDFLDCFKKYRNITTLNKDILHELIEKIVIYENNKIVIKYKFADEFKMILEAMEEE